MTDQPGSTERPLIYSLPIGGARRDVSPVELMASGRSTGLPFADRKTADDRGIGLGWLVWFPFSLVLGDDGSGAVSGSEARGLSQWAVASCSAPSVPRSFPTFGVPDLDATKGTCDDDAAVETTQSLADGGSSRTRPCASGVTSSALARKVPECVHVDATSGDLRFESFGHPVETLRSGGWPDSDRGGVMKAPSASLGRNDEGRMRRPLSSIVCSKLPTKRAISSPSHVFGAYLLSTKKSAQST